VRAALVVLSLASMTLGGGCAELGVVTDGSSISYGRPSRGYLIDGVRFPDRGDGFTSRDNWIERGNRYGTNELVELLKGVSKRMKKHAKEVRLVVADLSGHGGGPATKFHRSHQTGRDVDLLYYMRDREGKPYEPHAMIAVDRTLSAKDRSGYTIDVPRTWKLVRDLLTAQEAYVQYIFMYQPIAQRLIEHAQSIGDDPVIIARAIKACRQPGDSAPHDDHMHVRIYCPAEDRPFGCVDIGPLDLLAERESEKQRMIATMANALPRASDTEPLDGVETAADVWQQTAMRAAVTERSTPATSASFRSLLRARADRIDLRGRR
jgi:penicillin-insensitive murein DD-endopeptidase